MRVYVQLQYVVAVDVDEETYGVEGRVALAEACAEDPDFYEHLSDGPNPFYDADFEVVTDEYWMDGLDTEKPHWQILVQPVPR